MTPTRDSDDMGVDRPLLGKPNPDAPLTRPYYRSLAEFERHVLDSRQADIERDQRMDYDPYA